MSRASAKRKARALPGVRYHAALANCPSGDMAIAIAHMGRSGPVLDEVMARTVTGGEAGVDAVYRGLREQGIEVSDDREAWRRAGAERPGDVRARAIARALELAGAH